MSITVTLYKFKGDKNIVDKTNYLTRYGWQYWTIPKTFERKKFTVDVQIGGLNIESQLFNYCYIEGLGYYFIDDIQYVGALSTNNSIRIYEYTLSIDVLMTYREYIYRATGTLVSTENINDNVYMEDTNFDTDVRKESEIIYFDNPFEEELQNVLLTVASGGNY